MMVVAVIFLLPGLALGQDYRQKLTMSPDRAYASMLSSAKSEKYDRVLSVFVNLKPLTDNLSEKERVNFESELTDAVISTEKKQVVTCLLKIISSDIGDHLSYVPDDLESNHFSVAKRRVRMTFTTYLLMEPYLRDAKSKKDWTIKQSFKRVLMVVESSARLKGDKKAQAIESLRQEIDTIVSTLRATVQKRIKIGALVPAFESIAR